MTLHGNETINLSKEVLKAISDMGFEEFSPIQSQAIPYLMEGFDVIGQAQTGTGKTAAFGIPIVEKVNINEKNVQALVLCPTRELSIQVAEEIAHLAKYKTELRVLPIYGGQPIERQIKGLKKGVQIVIGTPGRVMDHIRRRTLKTGNIKMFVLDEADEMFDMGFREDIETVLEDIPEGRQSLFFSATMAKSIMEFAKTHQYDPKVVKVVHKEMTVPKVIQYYYDLQSNMKTEILSRVLDILDPKLTVVFCNTKRMVDDLTQNLQARGYFAGGLHGDLKQTQRDAVMNKFRKGIIDILLATDVAARGIDVDDVDLVINYDMPQDSEYYVHRIGRTARAGRTGTAISFVTGRDKNILREVQKYTKTQIERRPLPLLKDLKESQVLKIAEEIRNIIENQNLENERELLQVLKGEQYSSEDIAAAVLKIYRGQNRLDGHEELDYVDNDKKLRRREHQDFSGKRRGKKGKDHHSMKNAARLHINIGKKKGATQRHILSAICNDANIKSKDIGSIDIFDKFSFVEINPKEASKVVKNLNGKHIRGTKVNVEKANPKK